MPRIDRGLSPIGPLERPLLMVSRPSWHSSLTGRGGHAADDPKTRIGDARARRCGPPVLLARKNFDAARFDKTERSDVVLLVARLLGKPPVSKMQFNGVGEMRPYVSPRTDRVL